MVGQRDVQGQRRRRYPAAPALIGVLTLSGAVGLTLAAGALGERNAAIVARQQADRQTVLTLYAQALSSGEQNGPAGALLWLAAAFSPNGKLVLAGSDDNMGPSVPMAGKL